MHAGSFWTYNRQEGFWIRGEAGWHQVRAGQQDVGRLPSQGVLGLSGFVRSPRRVNSIYRDMLYRQGERSDKAIMPGV